ALLERQPDIESDALAAGLRGAAIGRLHDPGTAAGTDGEAMARRLEREAPLRQLVRKLAGVFVVSRPFERLAASLQRRRMLRGLRMVPALKALERALGLNAAVDARGAEKDDGVLDVLRFQPPQRLQVLRDDPDRTRVVALQERGIHVRERLFVHI